MLSSAKWLLQYLSNCSIVISISSCCCCRRFVAYVATVFFQSQSESQMLRIPSKTAMNHLTKSESSSNTHKGTHESNIVSVKSVFVRVYIGPLVWSIGGWCFYSKQSSNNNKINMGKEPFPNLPLPVVESPPILVPPLMAIPVSGWFTEGNA